MCVYSSIFMFLPFLTFGFQASRTLIGEPSSSSSRSSRSSTAKHPYTRGHSARRLDYITEASLFSPEARGHPAADREFPPVSLIPYHECDKPFTNLTLDGSMVANGMRAWNSEGGVTKEAWFALYTYANHCNACQLTFSIDGYRKHLDSDGECPRPKSGCAEHTNRGMCIFHNPNCADSYPLVS